MLILQNVVLPGMIVPAIAALLGLLVGRLLHRGDAAAGTGGALPLGLSFVAAYVAIAGWPRWMPVEATQRLFFFIVLAALLSAPLRRLNSGARLAAVFVLATPATALLLQAQIQHRWSGAQSAVWILALGALSVVLAAAWTQATQVAVSSRDTGPHPSVWHDAVLHAALIGSAALALGLTGSAFLGQMMGAVAIGCLVVGIAQCLGNKVWHPADGLVWLLSAGGLVLLGFFYSELGGLPAILLTASLVLLAGHHPGSSVPRKMLILLPALVAAALAVYGVVTAPPDPYAGYG